MIARVGITVDALDEVSSDPHLPPALVFAQHYNLTMTLLKHGALVFSAVEEKKAMLAWVKELGAVSADAQRLWVEALKALDKRRRMTSLDPAAGELRSALEPAALQTWRGRLEVAVVDSDQVRSLGAAPPHLALHDAGSGLDVTCASLTGGCDTFRRFERLVEDGTWAHGERRDDFFDQILSALARDSYVIRVVDRYLFRDLWKRRADSALVWLLERLDRLASTHYREVVVMSEVAPSGAPNSRGEQTCPRDVEEAGRCLMEQWRGRSTGGVTRVTVVGARISADHPLPHDRHIAFDVGVGINLPAGLDRFSTSHVQVAEGVTWAYLTALKALEKLNVTEGRFRQGRGSAEVIAYQQTRV